MGRLVRCVHKACVAGILDLLDLLPEHTEQHHVAVPLGPRVLRQCLAGGRAQIVQPAGRHSQVRLETGGAQARQRELHAVDHPGALP